MTPFRSGSFIRRAKDITISSTLALAIMAGGIALPGCSTNNNEDEYSYAADTSYSQGIRSHIKEVSPGEFQITNEETVPFDQAAAIVSYQDGHSDTLSPTAAKALIDKEIQTNQSAGMHSGLSNVLLYGGMGFMLGRMMNMGYINSYRGQANNPSRFYSNPATYQRSQSAYTDVSRSRVVTSRPAGGRSGFFNRSSGRVGG
ncbi:hypothetical protein [Telluribacter sp. SYSU D00476]|uniref:hypothetical protein n=1 Tax=Telluribacter sp. SYSU D00476 TaxID=2811430 RepID=UPI001FF53AD4|nr:hypothetical protein [Telluribacter sp. SYSU D00476]